MIENINSKNNFNTDNTVVAITKIISNSEYKFIHIKDNLYYTSDRAISFLKSIDFVQAYFEIGHKHHESVAYLYERKCIDGTIRVELLKSDFAYEFRKLVEKYIDEEYSYSDEIETNYNLIFNTLMDLGHTSDGEEFCRDIVSLYVRWEEEYLK